MLPNSLKTWIETFESNNIYAFERIENPDTKYNYNMDICSTVTDVYKNSWNGFFDSEVYCFGHSDYGVGTFSLLVYDDTNKIKKYICDAGGAKIPIMEFNDIYELLKYDSTNLYPSFEDLKNKYMDWKLKDSHVFM